MLKVNEEKLLQDHKELVEKKEKNLAAIEIDAKAYAVAHGYDEEKTAKFVAFTQDIQGNGLSDKENAKLEILSACIDEVEETPAEEAESAGVATETDPVLRVGVVNNI